MLSIVFLECFFLGLPDKMPIYFQNAAKLFLP